MTEDIFQNAGALSSQLRQALEGVPRALERVVPPEVREEDAVLDANAALLWQGFCRVMRMAGNLESLGGRAVLASGDIVGLCREVMARVELPAELLGLEVSFRSVRSSHIIAMDAPRVERMLLNLLSNAFKATPEGGWVSLEVRVEGEWVRLTVSDSGCGLGAEPEGLGLRACWSIAGAHGGSLMLLERAEGGTTAVASLMNRKGERGACALEPDGGFNSTLVGLSDALPKEAFAQRFWD